MVTGVQNCSVLEGKKSQRGKHVQRVSFCFLSASDHHGDSVYINVKKVCRLWQHNMQPTHSVYIYKWTVQPIELHTPHTLLVVG